MKNKRLIFLFFAAMTLSSLSVFAERQVSIVPQAVSLQTLPGEFTLAQNTRIVVDEGTRELGTKLAEMLKPATGWSLKVGAAGWFSNQIVLKLDGEAASLGKEGYRLNVSKRKIVITSAGEAGIFYGMQTLRQLLPVEIFSGSIVEGQKWTVPCVAIEDYPRFQWRGMMLDVGRHFFDVDFVKKYIDTMALHKMNTFHWHLTEDQGWRIEIKKYPKLTEVGAWRDETVIGKTDPRQFDGKRHGGFYTQDQIRDIVKYAADRYITIVPEIEMPGHCQAALAAYPELGNTGEQLPVRTYWGVNENVFNVDESTIMFLQDVLTEVMDLFPSKFIHIGGDEAPKKQWQQSKAAQDRMKELGLKDENELQSWFIGRMDKFLAEHGRRLIGWDEILEGGLAPGATVMSWRGEAGGIAAAKSGHDVVMAPNTHLYINFYQAEPSREPLSNGKYLPLEKVYSYNPVPQSLTEDEAKHILGMQAQLWTEFISTSELAEYMVYPRALAVAEAAWTPVERKQYDDFYRRLPTHLNRLDKLDVNYRRLDPIRYFVADWSVKSEKFTPVEWDITPYVKDAGEYKVHFNLSRGVGLNIKDVQLMCDGSMVAQDNHASAADGLSNDSVYKLSAAKLKDNGKCVLKALVRSDKGKDSIGVVSISKERE